MLLTSRWVRFGWFVTGVVGIAALMLLALQERSRKAADRWVDHTLEVVVAVQEAKSAMRGASNELRGYVLTHQPLYLTGYQRHLANAEAGAGRIQDLLKDNPAEEDRALRLHADLRQYGKWTALLLEGLQNRGEAAAVAEIATGRGEAMQGSLDQLANDMLAQERSLLTVRQHKAAQLQKLAFGLEVLLGLLVVGQLVASAYLARAKHLADSREQETLRQAQAYAEAIVATIREPLVVLDSYLRVVSANRAFYALFQCAPEQTEGLPFTEIGGGVWNIPELIAHFHSVIDEHEHLESFRLQHRFAGLGPRILLVNARKVYQPGVRTGLLLLALQDDTDRTLAEQRLEQVNVELQGFAYSVAHDLRAPLRGMQGFSEALRDDYSAVLDETGRSYTTRIAGAAKRMDELIRDLLDYSRLARADLPLGPVEVRQAVAAARQQLASALAESRATLTVADELPLVIGHFGTLVQILANLIGNSLKFVAPGVVPAITVRAEARGTIWRIVVEDNGIGVAPQFHDKIFRVFERLHGTEEYPGTGIGLAVVRKGMERLGGKAGVESAAGRGASFWVELPAAPVPTR